MEIVIKLSTNWQTLALAGMALILFGFFYNQVVDRLGEKQEGYTSLLVVCGVIVNLIALAAVYGLGAALVSALFFTCSGGPMIAGEVMRSLRKKAHARKVLDETLERRLWLSESENEK